MFIPQNLLISGGSFTLNTNKEAHYYGLRRASPIIYFLCETHIFLKSVDGSDILKHATAAAAFHNSAERFDAPKCHPNTRVAVLNKIMKWIKREADLDTFIMWLYGPAGAGKSAIAEKIAEMCEQEMILLASFFFSRNDPSRCSAKLLIATIVYQIVEIRVDSGNGCRELRGKRVPINIKIQRLIYVNNIHTKHAYH